jgi:IS5 family transposase
MKTQSTAVSAIVAEIQELCNEAKVDENVHRGPVAVFTPSFIVTVLILKNLFGFSSERSFVRYLKNHHSHTFPSLPERSWFNRKARKCVGIEKEIHALLLQKLKAHRIEIRIVDTTPVPVVKLWRAGHCRSFERKTEVNYGYCASKKLYYYGQKLTLLTTPEGLPTEHILTPANVHDVRVLKENLASLTGIRRKKIIADKGYYDGELEVELEKKYCTRLIVPEKKRHQKKNTREEKRLLKTRSIIETANNQLQDQMNIDETRAKSVSGLTSRIQSAILSFAFSSENDDPSPQAPSIDISMNERLI